MTLPLSSKLSSSSELKTRLSLPGRRSARRPTDRRSRSTLPVVMTARGPRRRRSSSARSERTTPLSGPIAAGPDVRPRPARRGSSHRRCRPAPGRVRPGRSARTRRCRPRRRKSADRGRSAGRSPKTRMPSRSRRCRCPPASYTSEPAGENPERPLEIGTGIVSVAMPSAGFAENDSPTPRTALPPRPSGCDAFHPAAGAARTVTSSPVSAPGVSAPREPSWLAVGLSGLARPISRRLSSSPRSLRLMPGSLQRRGTSDDTPAALRDNPRVHRTTRPDRTCPTSVATFAPPQMRFNATWKRWVPSKRRSADCPG